MNNPASDRFSEWFEEEHGGSDFELESDADECIEDRYDDPESY